jgi:hypothetical protein
MIPVRENGEVDIIYPYIYNYIYIPLATDSQSFNEKWFKDKFCGKLCHPTPQKFPLIQ